MAREIPRPLPPKHVVEQELDRWGHMHGFTVRKEHWCRTDEGGERVEDAGDAFVVERPNRWPVLRSLVPHMTELIVVLRDGDVNPSAPTGRSPRLLRIIGRNPGRSGEVLALLTAIPDDALALESPVNVITAGRYGIWLHAPHG